MMLPVERKKFWSKTAAGENGCINWIGSVSKQGYPMFYTEHDAMIFAHRAIYEDTYGRIRGDMRIIKACGNKLCVNPEHLQLGDCRDVYHNEQRHGRNWVHKRYGEENNASKLKATQVLEIRETYASGGHRMKDLARQYGVSQALISLIVRKKRWPMLNA